MLDVSEKSGRWEVTNEEKKNIEYIGKKEKHWGKTIQMTKFSRK
jgi:hypothetical protein